MLAQVDSDLSAQQKARLHELEAVVESGLTSFLAVGRALLEIKDSGLYRDYYATFEQYCTLRWGLTGHRGLQIIRSTVTAEHLLAGPAGPDGDAPLPQDLAENVMRPLSRLRPELAAECWRLAARVSPRPTRFIVGRIVRTVQSAIDEGTGTSPKVNRQEKDVFFPSLYKLAAGESFSGYGEAQEKQLEVAYR